MYRAGIGRPDTLCVGAAECSAAVCYVREGVFREVNHTKGRVISWTRVGWREYTIHVYIYIYIYVCMYVCIYTYVYIYIYIYIYSFIN